MSSKMAIIIGDYSNGWSDSIQIQQVTKIETIKNFGNDKDFVLSVLAKHLNQAVNELENNETINPQPKDEPCCDKFKEWSGSITEMDKDVKVCPFCAIKITEERRKRFIKIKEV